MFINLRLTFAEKRVFQRWFDTEVFSDIKLKRLLRSLNNEVIPDTAECPKIVTDTIELNEGYNPQATETVLYRHGDTSVKVQKCKYDTENEQFLRGEIFKYINL